MNRFRRSGRSHALRSGSGLLSRLMRGMRRTESLAASAGQAPAGFGEHFESLEQRQLLFSYTILPQQVDPATGLATIRGEFAYVNPYLSFTQQINPVAGQQVSEDFNRTEPGTVNPPPFGTPIASGYVFTGSNIRFDYGVPAVPQLPFQNVLPLTALNLVQVGAEPGTNNAVRATLEAQQYLSIRASLSQANNAFFLFTGMTMDIAGLDTATTSVQIIRGDQVLRTITGTELDQLGQPANGAGFRQFTFVAPGNEPFDTVRFFKGVGAPSANIRFDNIRFSVPGGTFANAVESRITGAAFVFTAPAGATIEFRDLYDRPLRETFALGIPPVGSANLTIVDPDDDGRPNFNDGIGRIIINGTDSRSTFSLYGLDFVKGNPLPVGTDFVEGLFGGNFPNTTAGFNWEGFGMGHSVTIPPGQAQPVISGFGGVTGNVIIGSPWIRPSVNYANDPGFVGQNAVPGPGVDFSRANQGIQVNSGSINWINVRGVVYGLSRVAGAIERFTVSSMLGSLQVGGDLGSFVSAGDAGAWSRDDGTAGLFRTNSQLVVGRTVRQIHVGGRSLMDVTVAGDLSNPSSRPSGEPYRYAELEFAQRPDTNFQGLTPRDVERLSYLSAGGSAYAAFQSNLLTEQVRLGLANFRNNSILGAEFVGSATSSVQIVGQLGFADPVQAAEDRIDIFAFPVEGNQDIIVSGQFPSNARIVDQDGRTLVSYGARSGSGLQALQLAGGGGIMRFRPEQRGVYYLVLEGFLNPNPPPFNAQLDEPYSVTISGMAPVTFGTYRAAGGITNTVVTVSSGSIGMITSAAPYQNGAGADVDPSESYNPNGGGLRATSALSGTWSALTGNIYAVYSGGDIAGLTLNVDGHLGRVTTGTSAIIAQGGATGSIDPRFGDLRNINWTIGGTIGTIDVRGAIGINQNSTLTLNDGRAVDAPSSVVIRTGRNPTLRGDIGLIRVGSDVGGSSMILQTSDSSRIGAFLIAQDAPLTRAPGATGGGATQFQGVYGTNSTPGSRPINFQLGVNSDIRFLDIPYFDQLSTLNVATTLLPDVPVIITDDSGARVSVVIRPGATGAGIGTLRALPVNGSQGQSIGRINVDLTGGARLEIVSLLSPGQTTAGPRDLISIGKIYVTGAEAASSISISGPIEVDVWQVQQIGGDAIGTISNTTPNGDIVVADVAALGSINIGTGSLGRTEMPSAGPRLIGPFVGVVGGTGATEAGAPIAIPAGVLTPQWNNALYRPLGALHNGGTVRFGDDIGMPANPYLNGLRVRTGGITSVTVGGAIGNIIATGGTVTTITANADNVNTPGRFEGIVGTILVGRLGTINVGDGLVNLDNSPIANAGIVATDDINSVVASRPGSELRGLIGAANIVINAADPFPVDGINSISLPGGGSIVDATILAATISEFWISAYTGGAAGFFSGEVRSITTVGGNAAAGAGNMFRSFVRGQQITSLTLRGAYDASKLESGTGDIQLVSAAEFRNSTLEGSELEIATSQIFTGGGNLLTLRTTGSGDISDLSVDIPNGRIQSITTRNLTRSQINATVRLESIALTGSMRASSITTGRLVNFNIAQNVNSSTISVAGVIETFRVGDSLVNSTITLTGPDASASRLVVANLFQGSIVSSGPIDTIESTNGDLRLNISTRVARGLSSGVRLLTAGRDLDLSGEIAGPVAELRAGRHIGNRATPSTLILRGNVDAINAPNGTLYGELRTVGTIRNAIFGAVDNRPGLSILGRGSLIAFGRIENVTIAGDWAGNIISYSGGIGVVTVNNGSLLAGSLVAAYSGDLNNIVINSGHLLGNVHADWNLLSIRLNASADGVFGDIGVNPALSSGVSAGALRNQLPPGVIATSAIDGPSITAGRNLGRIVLTNGSIFEAFIRAERAIGTLDINGSITSDGQTSGYSTVIASGSTIFLVSASGQINETAILAGVVSFGADNRPGGTGPDADVMRSGRITTVTANGSGRNTAIAAGMEPGADGLLNTGDERVALGISFIRQATFGGGVTNVTAFADSPTLNASAGVQLGGTTFETADPDLVPGPVGTQIPAGVATSYNVSGGVTILFTGRGRAFFDINTRTLALVNTGLDSFVTVTAASGSLTDFRIVTNDDASMGSIIVQGALAGDSRIVVDAYAALIQTGSIGGTTQIKSGMNLRTLTTGPVVSGTFTLPFWVRDIAVNGNFGSSGVTPRISALAGNSVRITGDSYGRVRFDRDLSSYVVDGLQGSGGVSTGSTLGSVTLGSARGADIAAGDSIGALSIGGRADGVYIAAGANLGADGALGGSGLNADTVRAADLGNVTIAGAFPRSSIMSGTLPGPDGFFGTNDDAVAPGLSRIGNVTIAGSEVGSNLNTEQYRISASSSIGTVLVAGQPATTQPNFRVEVQETLPQSIQVVSINTQPVSGTWTATIQFNQAMQESTIAPSISIAEVRDGGLTLIPLTQGTDYTVAGYDPVTNIATILFSRAITERALVPQTGQPQAGVPSIGVYRFTLDGSVLRARQTGARLDANADGRGLDAETFVRNRVVGDAGDKFTGVVLSAPVTGGNPETINFYGPTDLDLILRDQFGSSVLPQTNVVNTIRGSIGDHPNHGLQAFQTGGDTDVFKITLQAGQILRLGKLEGAARQAFRTLYFQDGSTFTPQFGSSDETLQLINQPATFSDFNSGDAYLIKRTGTYYIVLGEGDPDSASVPNTAPQVGAVGDYNFTVEVFDDGNSGFAAGTFSGSAQAIPDAPTPIVFAGPNGIFQNPSDPGYDDREFVQIGAFTFTLDRGTDGVRGTADDIVSGTNADGTIVSTRRGANLTTTVNSAIGPRGHRGVPGNVITPDVDVYSINNGQVIPAGRQVTVRVKLSDLGADLGSAAQIAQAGLDTPIFTSFNGQVQFGIFDITNAQSIDDGLLLFAPKEFKPFGGKPGTISSDGGVTYGYDASGDFFVTFVAPGRLNGSRTDPGAYAIYLQGVFNTDYSIEYTQTDNVLVSGPAPRRQNIFIETRGGSIDWLEVGGLTTTLAPYTSGVLGFAGTINGQTADQYILNRITSTVQSAFTAAGLNVVVSTNPFDFRGQDFSTIFLTSTNDVKSIANSDVFGYSQRSDPFNTDRNDEAVVFLPALNALNYSTSPQDADNLAVSAAAAIVRRAGELMGARLTTGEGFGQPTVDALAANSVLAIPNSPSGLQILDQSRRLADPFEFPGTTDTQFFLGQQNAFALLRKFLNP